MKKIAFSIALIAGLTSSIAFAHEGKLDKNGGHACKGAKNICNGHDYHYHKDGKTIYGRNNGKAVDAEGVSINSDFDYSQKSDFITFNNHLKYKKIVEVVDGKEVDSVMLMQRLPNSEVFRFASFILKAKPEQGFVNIYLQEQSEKKHRVLMDLDDVRDVNDTTLEGKKPWAVFKDGDLVINGLSLSEFKSLKLKTADVNGSIMSAWIDPVKELKFEVYEKLEGYVLAEISLDSVILKDASLSELGPMIKVETESMKEEGEFYAFGQVGVKDVEFYKDGESLYKIKKLKRNFD